MNYQGFILSVMLVMTGCQAATPPAASYPETFALIQLNLGSQQIAVQLADTEAKRAQGLMGQQPLKHGMLLLNPQARAMTLWMKNTPTALDVAFIDQQWRIISIAQMQPFSEQLHDSPKPALAALEMPLGWFAKQNIQPGQQLVFCPEQPKQCLATATTQLE